MKGLRTQTLEVTEPIYGMIDLAADKGDHVELRVQREIGPGRNWKVYLDVNGQTILRICKLKRDQVKMSDEL